MKGETMNDLIRILFDYLSSDDGPEIYDDEGEPFDDGDCLELAQQVAEAIVAAGWPRR